MSCRGIVVALAAAALGSALGVTPAAYADDDQLLYPPGTIGPIGGPTDVQTIDASPFFEYHQESGLYNVLDGGNSLGQFTDMHSYFISPYQPFGVWFSDTHDVISDSTYAGLADGATQDNATVSTLGLTGVLVLLENDYVNNPGIATSDFVTLFGVTFPLWDIPADTTSSAALGVAGLF